MLIPGFTACPAWDWLRDWPSRRISTNQHEKVWSSSSSPIKIPSYAGIINQFKIHGSQKEGLQWNLSVKCLRNVMIFVNLWRRGTYLWNASMNLNSRKIYTKYPEITFSISQAPLYSPSSERSEIINLHSILFFHSVHDLCKYNKSLNIFSPDPHCQFTSQQPATRCKCICNHEKKRRRDQMQWFTESFNILRSSCHIPSTDGSISILFLSLFTLHIAKTDRQAVRQSVSGRGRCACQLYYCRRVRRRQGTAPSHPSSKQHGSGEFAFSVLFPRKYLQDVKQMSHFSHATRRYAISGPFSWPSGFLLFQSLSSSVAEQIV